MKTELLPPLALMKKWREEEGLNPQQVKAKATAWVTGSEQMVKEPEPEPVKRPEPRQQRPPKVLQQPKTPTPSTRKERIRAIKEAVASFTQPKTAQAIPVFSFPAPAGQGYRCDAFHLNPSYGANPDAPRFIHCRQIAVHRLVIRDERRARNVKRCSGCAYDLRYQAANGLGGIKIESDEPLRRK